METFKCSKCEIDVIKSECRNRSMMCFSCNKQKLKEKQKELMRQYYIKNRDEYNLKNMKNIMKQHEKISFIIKNQMEDIM